MKFQNSHHYSPEIELILHPQSYSFKEISKYIVASILALSQQYSDPDGMRTARIQSNLRWHAISEVYEPAFGACKYTNQLQ